MDFKTEHPDFAPVEEYVRRAHAERAVHLAQLFANAVDALVRGFKRVAHLAAEGVAAERDRRAIEAAPFLKRAVPRN